MCRDDVTKNNYPFIVRICKKKMYFMSMFLFNHSQFVSVPTEWNRSKAPSILNMMGLGGQLHALATQCTYWIGGWASKLGQMSHIREVTVNGLDACGLIPDRSRDFTMWKHLRLFFWTFVHRHICKVKLVFQKLFVLIPSFLLEDRSRTQHLKWWTKSKRTDFSVHCCHA